MDSQPSTVLRYLKCINGILEKRLNRLLKEVDLTLSQADVLWFLKSRKHQKTIQRDIEDFFQRSNPTVTGLLNRLEQKGLIKRSHSLSDKRIHYIELTEEAEKIIKSFHDEKAFYSKNILASLKPEEQKQLEKLLQKLMHGLMTSEEGIHD